MEEDLLFEDLEADRDSVSTSCFMSDHEGFFGSIKNSTRDFVVTEINISGQLVTETTSLDDHVSPQLSDNSGPLCLGGELTIVGNASPLTTGDVKEETDSTPDELGCATVDCHDTDTAAGCEDVSDLQAVLGHAASEALEQFAASVRDARRLKKTTKNTELSLGIFPEKEQRALVHRAVRNSFPFLMTLTNKTEVLVKEDPDYEELARLVSEEEAEGFFRFIDAKVPNASFTFAQDDCKEHRKAVHHFLSRRFGKLVETKSFNDVAAGPGLQKTAITVRFRARTKPAKKRTAASCQEESVIYTGFTLRKENLETLEAISYMAALLGILPSDFTYAGIKDKRALTHQSMVVKKISPERLMQKSPELEKKGLQLSQVQPVSQPLHLGRLQGNRFQLVVRDLRPHRPDSGTDLPRLVHEALENVKANGFVNLYGPQRFGASQTVKADQVGLALLKEEMVTAVRLFFTPDEGDDLQNRAKSHFLQTGEAKQSLALMPEHKVRERLMLRALHRYGAGPEGSARGWLSLPHGMRLFYVHAYCSRVWNRAAAFRLRRLGRGPTALRGDLVRTREGRGGAREQTPQEVHVVTAAEEAEGAFSLSQVVLPMPGNGVKYPENAVGRWYQERLERDGLRNCRFRIAPLKLNVPGCYRPLLAYPRNLAHRLRGLPGGGSAVVGGGSPADPGGPSLALTFDLDASCYATVCLREIMKCEP